MDPEYIAAWRDYLARQMHEQYGIAIHEARLAVTRWLRLLHHRVTPQAYQVPEAARIRNERRPLRTTPAAGRARSARA